MGKSRAFLRPWLLGLLLALTGILVPGIAGAADGDENGVPAMILKVEGDGIAKVKKAFGAESTAGTGGKIYPGDRIITDARSAVYISLNDGSILKVGLSSEFKMESVEMHDRFLSWAFRVVTGTMRAMVEKNPEPDTRLRVHTPSGTIGVRGTEFVVAVEEESKTSYLYTLEGLVAFGAPGCEKAATCVEVRAGETTSLQEGQTMPPKPAAFHSRDLFGVVKDAEGRDVASKRTDQRMSLFQDTKRVTARFKQDLDEETLKRLVQEASESLASAQDRAIGRTKEQRLAMYEAIKNGTYRDVLEAADAYAEATDIFKADANDGAENLVAQTAAAKFRLGLAVKQAREEGVFGNLGVGKGADVNVKWKEEKFQQAKNVDYDRASAAKSKRESLARAADEYKKVLEFTEAHPSAGSASGKGNGNASSSAKGGKLSVVAQDAAGACKGKDCRSRAVVHELNAASEGVVGAFAGGVKADGKASSFSAASNNKGEVKTGFFRKAIPGDACYREEKDCKLVPCPAFSQGKKCKKGESLKDCTVKKVPVRCPD